jgi:hypothetical protein
MRDDHLARFLIRTAETFGDVSFLSVSAAIQFGT